MQEEDVFSGKTIERASILKEGEKGLVIGVSRVMGKVCGRVRQLSVAFSKVIIPIEDNNGTALICQKISEEGFGIV